MHGGLATCLRPTHDIPAIAAGTMKLKPQHTAELDRLGELIEGTPVAMMATQDEAGAIVSRPKTTLEMDTKGALWFFTDLRSTKLEQLQADNLSFADGDKPSYVFLSGRGETETDAAHIHGLLTPFATAWFPDGSSSPNLALLKFVPGAAEFWDASSCRMVRLYAVVASIVSGKAAAMGEHESYPDLRSNHDGRSRAGEARAILSV